MTSLPVPVVAIIAILIGLIGCFYGYPLFRGWLILMGLVVGYVIGTNFVAPDQWFLALVIGIIAAIVLAVLAYPLWSIGVFLIGIVVGFSLFASLGVALNFDQGAILLLGVLGAIVLGFLFYSARDIMAMVITAFNGAVLIIYGIGLLLVPALRFGGVDAVEGNPLALIAIIILGAIGFGAQYQMFKGRRLYLRP